VGHGVRFDATMAWPIGEVVHVFVGPELGVAIHRCVVESSGLVWVVAVIGILGAV